MRRAPPRPSADIKIDYLKVGGNKLRFIKPGSGPTLILLHTLRTQLDLFEKVIPELSKQFTVYALDYPGHGYSDIPRSCYDAAFFVEAVEGFIERLDLRDVTLAVISIGGAIPLKSWEDATKDYGRIDIPVLLIWGDKDWANPSEREHDAKLIPGVRVVTLERGGHFLALDRPQELRDLIIQFSTDHARVTHHDMS